MIAYNWRFRNKDKEFDDYPDQDKACYMLLEDGLFPNSLPFVVRGTYDKDSDMWCSTIAGRLSVLSTSYDIVAWRYEEDDNQ